jgi:cytochrome c oxidase subunit 2
MRIPRLPSLLNYLLRVACVLPVPILLGGWGMDGKMSTMEVDGPVARTQLDLFMVTFWVTGFIFVCVAAVLAYATIKFRARSSADEHAEPPPQGHGNPVIEIGLIVVSVLMLVIIAVPTLKAIWSTYDVPESNKEKIPDNSRSSAPICSAVDQAGSRLKKPRQMPCQTR